MTTSTQTPTNRLHAFHRTVSAQTSNIIQNMTSTPRLHPAMGLAGRPQRPQVQNKTQTRTSFDSACTRTGSVTSILYKSPDVDTASLFSADTLCAVEPSSKTKLKSKARRAWEFVKKEALEHHRVVNMAYRAYHGAGVGTGAVRRWKQPTGST